MEQILIYIGLVGLFTIVFIIVYQLSKIRKKKNQPIKESDIFDKNFESHWKNLAREVNKLNKNMAYNRNYAMPFKTIKFYVYVVADEKLNILGCYFQKELAEYIAGYGCPEHEKKFIQEIEVKNSIK